MKHAVDVRPGFVGESSSKKSKVAVRFGRDAKLLDFGCGEGFANDSRVE